MFAIYKCLSSGRKSTPILQHRFGSPLELAVDRLDRLGALDRLDLQETLDLQEALGLQDLQDRLDRQARLCLLLSSMFRLERHL